MKNFTTLETQVIATMINELDMWIGQEGYSPIEALDISNATGIEIKTLRAVLSSLIKKNIVHSWKTEIDWNMTTNKVINATFFSFVDQENKSVEELENLIK